jgi:predicted DNA-binding transcriptional regulator YafY
VTDVVLDVAGLAWFERLLLQLGPESYVVRPPELADLAARAAEKVLRLYREDEKD